MKRVKQIVLLGATLGLFTFGWIVPAVVHAETQTECPVMEGKIDKNIYTDYQGKRIYFCCAGCLKEFQKDPEKYLKKMEEKGVIPEKTP